MDRVVDTFRPNRNRVVISSRDGKMENSSASEMVIVTIKITMDREMLIIIRISSKLSCTGIIRNMTMTTTISAMLF